MELKSVIKRIVSRNPWLSDPLTDYEDLFRVVECKSVEELYNALKNWAGAFKYENLLFINSYHYGVFVYDLRASVKDYVEHLDIEYMDDNRFAKLVNKLLEK
jgi:hypothetical protein